MFVSCKSKKSTTTNASAADQENSANSSQQTELKFGYQYINGCAERMKGNLREALALFEECRRLDPKNMPVYYELGTIYKLLGANEMALKNAKVCAAADPKNEWYQLLLIECYNPENNTRKP